MSGPDRTRVVLVDLAANRSIEAPSADLTVARRRGVRMSPM